LTAPTRAELSIWSKLISLRMNEAFLRTAGD
jgi:hypothetical protein